MKVHFGIGHALAENPEDEYWRSKLKSGLGCASKSTGDAWVFIDNVASVAYFTASQFDGYDCIYCSHAKLEEGSCKLDFDLLLASVSKQIVSVTIHEMLHVLGCDEDQAVAGVNMLGEEFTCETNCPMFSSAPEPEAVGGYNRAEGGGL